MLARGPIDPPHGTLMEESKSTRPGGNGALEGSSISSACNWNRYMKNSPGMTAWLSCALRDALDGDGGGKCAGDLKSIRLMDCVSCECWLASSRALTSVTEMYSKLSTKSVNGTPCPSTRGLEGKLVGMLGGGKDLSKSRMSRGTPNVRKWVRASKREAKRNCCT